MSGTSNADIERAEARVSQETEAAIARAQASLEGHGSETCIDCGEAIEEMRRRLMPSATRCTHCQTRHEFGRPR